MAVLEQEERADSVHKGERVLASSTNRTTALQTQRLDEADTDPFRLARAFLDSDGKDARGRVTIRFWRGQWYRYRDGRYVETEEHTMRVELTGFIKEYFDEKRCVDRNGLVRRVGKSLVSNAVNALSALGAVPDVVEMPAWLGDGDRGPFLATTNGLLDISKLPDGAIRLGENSPLWFSTAAFPVAYDRNATCGRWLKFLDEVMEADPDRIALLQEWVGYLLTSDTSQHKFVVAEGEGANGKSVLFEVLTALLGPENVAHVPLEMFGTRFQLTATLNKRANICAEVGEIDKVAEGFLKQFTAGDRMYFDRKNISGVMAYPTARLMLSSNNRPRFRDRSAGLWRRMMVIPFRVTIPIERQDPLLKEKLKAELPGVLLWAIEGLKRLRRNGMFTLPAVCQDALEDYRQESNPAKVFLTESCEEKSTASTPSTLLYKRYVVWTKENGFETLDSRQFGKEVKKAFPKVARHRIVRAGKRPWVYRGLSCVPTGPMSSYPDESDVEQVEMSKNVTGHLGHGTPPAVATVKVRGGTWPQRR
jgi:P4 family phage/plasmid primase-like protien